MSKAAHTPGPWRYYMGDICVDGDDGDDRIVAGIGKSCGARSSVYSPISNHRPEGIANARLIAAAPDLLDALERIVALCDACPGVADGAAEIARAAISEAKGGA